MRWLEQPARSGITGTESFSGLSPIDNGILEGIDGSIQACKARAGGYRCNENLISMIYLIAGKLQIGLPT